jgi:predicted nucleotidyltransferase
MKHLKPYNQFLNEGEFYKGELNPIFWQDQKFNPEVRTKLLQIATDFYTDLKVEAPIIDIHLTGSLANFNWTEHSDLDVHVILDFTIIGDDVELVKKAVDGLRFIWNLRHPVKIQGFDVELYAQDKDEPHVASGLYSLMKDEWITVPEPSNPTIDEKDVYRKVEAFITEIEELEKEVVKSDSDQAREVQDRISALKQKIMKSRKEGLAANGEFSIENLVFKQLRNQGYLERLIDLGADAYSHIYSEPNDSLDDQPSDVNENTQLGKGSCVVVLGPEVQGQKRLFLFHADWFNEVERNGWKVKMVGLGAPSLVVNQDGRLVAKQVNMNAANLKKFAGLSSNTVVLNSKTKTPYWHQTVKYTNHQTLLNDMGRTLMSIPGVSFD